MTIYGLLEGTQACTSVQCEMEPAQFGDSGEWWSQVRSTHVVDYMSLSVYTRIAMKIAIVTRDHTEHLLCSMVTLLPPL